MADVKLECPNCGAFFQISEYVDSKHIQCPQCNESLEVATARVQENRLQVRRDRFGSGSETTTPPAPASAEKAPEERRGKKKKKKKNEPAHASSETPPVKPFKDPYQKTAPKRWHGLLAFVSLFGILFSLLYFGNQGVIDEGYYYFVRVFLYPSISCAVIFAAFSEGYLPGALCLFLPPYLVYYAVSRTDAYSIRGAFTAILIVLACEIFIEPDRSVVKIAENSIQSVINAGTGAIDRAGNSGVEYK